MANDNSGVLTIYRIFSTALAVCMLGILSWMGINVSHIPAIEIHIEDMEKKFDTQSADLKADMLATNRWQTEKLNDLDTRLRVLEAKGGHR